MLHFHAPTQARYLCCSQNSSPFPAFSTTKAGPCHTLGQCWWAQLTLPASALSLTWMMVCTLRVGLVVVLLGASIVFARRCLVMSGTGWEREVLV